MKFPPTHPSIRLLLAAALLFAAGCDDDIYSSHDSSDHAVCLFAEEGYLDPIWSPTGAMLMYAAPGETEKHLDLWWNRDEMGGYSWIPAYEGAGNDRYADWRGGDPEQIAFASDAGGGWDILLFEPSDPHPQVVVDDPADDIQPSWSFLSYKLAFASDRSGDWDIWVHYLSNGEDARVTIDAAADTDPAWCPREDRIAFVSDRSGNNDIWLVYPSYGEMRRLTENGADDVEPCWSPDGERVVFASNRSGDYALWMIDADGGEPERLTDSRGNDRTPDWSPDGEYIVFISDRPIWEEDTGGYRIFKLLAPR